MSKQHGRHKSAGKSDVDKIFVRKDQKSNFKRLFQLILGMKNLSFLKAGVPLSLSPFNCIALGKNGGSLKKIPFPFGVHALIRNISATLGVQEIHPAELERKKEITFHTF